MELSNQKILANTWANSSRITSHASRHHVLSLLPRWHRVTPNLLIGGSIVVLILLFALAAPLIAPYAPDKVMAGARLSPPSAEYLFGTDSLGRDVFSRVLYGAQIAVGIVALGLSISAGLGIGLGLLAGYHGGWFDQILSRAMEVWQAFPALLLALVIVARLGPSLENAVIAMGIVSAPGFYRLARNLTLSAKCSLYVQAAQAVGAKNNRIILRHILPNLQSSLVVMMTMRSGMLLLASGGLSFIGLGAQPPSPEWGALLASGRNYLETAPWLAIYPGCVITLTVVGCNLLGDGLRDWLDPKK
ncbi:MAG: ABC transporter permease [Chloroflexi bacterium]|nr:ABC transporter permease [Chloroflexota bacterium]